MDSDFFSIDDVRQSLAFVSPNIDRNAWAAVAMALKAEFGEEAFDLFDTWSEGGESYRSADCRSTWKSVRADGGVGLGTLIHMAKQGGWSPEKPELSDADKKKLAEERSARREKIKAKAQQEVRVRQEKVDRCRERSAEIWQGLSESGRSEYLASKNVRAWGVRFARGRLAVPVCDVAGLLVGLQWIDERGGKKFLTGTQKSGSWHMIGEPSPRAPLAVAEGYATAATIHQATGWPVAVAFDAGNLSPVAAALYERYPNALFMVCADDDWKTEGNPGVSKATEAARRCRGRVAVPEFGGADHERGTDWNDLHVAQGVDVVKKQLCAATQRVTEAPAPPVIDAARLTLEAAVEQFALALPDAKVWDLQKRRLMNKQAAKTYFGDIWDDWLKHPSRRTVDQEDVRDDIAAAKIEGRGGLADAIKRYVYLSGTTDVWDRLRREVVGINPLRLMLAADFDEWLKSPQRQELHHTDLIFDPTQKGRDGAFINKFRGLPLQPVRNDDACEGIRHLVWQLCNENDEDWSWLVSWLALPLQRVGAKLATAVLMHSSMQGAGKSLLFDRVMRQIYGEYSVTVSQHELEDRYTVWRSQKLYAVYEEIFARGQKYDHMGLVKQMITGETFRVEQKFVTGWEEVNSMNSVFLSNEVQPMHIEEEDRRFFVVWPQKRLDPKLQAKVIDEISHGGVEAFYAWLMAFDLKGFNPHTKPPRSKAKERLIDFGRAGWETFALQWREGELDAPVGPVRIGDIYLYYERWCRRNGERPISSNKFQGLFKSLEWIRFRRDLHYKDGLSDKKARFFIPREWEPPENKGQSEWLGVSVKAWAGLLKEGGHHGSYADAA